MRYIKRRLTSPHTTGLVSYVLSQNSGPQEFRRLYRAHRDDPRPQIAAGLRQARREIRAEVAAWEAAAESERQRVAQLVKKLQHWKKTVDQK